MFQLPVTNCMVQLEINYTSPNVPSMTITDATWDACKLLANRKRSLAFGHLHKLIAQFVNINHTCPYNHDIIGKNLYFDRNKVPFPTLPGVYIAKIGFSVNGQKKLNFDVDIKV
ncbi:uncharacterized protein LOC142239532 [Haematobia irritans]|uniref:uncharacterized protein LOC142239532 n=1 Tax=Haematobia irritans TaxID=7368 RepID=UPI003F50B146